MTSAPLLEIKSLGKRFPGRAGREPSPWVIQDLSFAVRPGELVTIIGPSGAGKSTLLNMIAQIDTASAGEIVFNGEAVTSHDARALRPRCDRKIGYVTHDITEAIALGDRALVLSRQPTRIAAEHAIPIPRPRNVQDIFALDGFAQIYERIRAAIQ